MNKTEVNFIVGRKPPNWDLLVKTFNVKWESTAVTLLWDSMFRK